MNTKEKATIRAAIKLYNKYSEEADSINEANVGKIVLRELRYLLKIKLTKKKMK